MSDKPATIRVDKWLWYARFFKTRSLAAKVVSGGHMRVNQVKIAKPAHGVTADDVLTFPQARDVRIVRIVATGTRRGPAAEAQTLYEDLTPPRPARENSPSPPKTEGKGRPTKKDRRDMFLSRDAPLE